MMINIRNEVEALYGTEPTISAPSNDAFCLSDQSKILYYTF
jgi:hypothetical protein